jgi:hypothetical protein
METRASIAAPAYPGSNALTDNGPPASGRDLGQHYLIRTHEAECVVDGLRGGPTMFSQISN